MYFYETIFYSLSYYLIQLPISFLYKLFNKEKKQQHHYHHYHHNSSSSSIAAVSSSSSSSSSSSLSSSSFTDDTDNSETDETIYNNDKDTVATTCDVKRGLCENNNNKNRGNTTLVYTDNNEKDVGFVNILGSGNINISSTYIKKHSKDIRKNDKWLHTKHRYNTRVSSANKFNRGCDQYKNNGPVTRSVTAKLKEKANLFSSTGWQSKHNFFFEK